MRKIFLVFVVFILTACGQTTQVYNSAHVKERDVLLAFEREGLQLEKAELSKNDDYGQKLAGTKPSAYLLDGKYVYIYELSSKEAVEKAKKEFAKNTETMNLVSAKMYEHRNVFIHYVHEKSLEDPVPYDEEITRALASIIEG